MFSSHFYSAFFLSFVVLGLISCSGETTNTTNDDIAGIEEPAVNPPIPNKSTTITLSWLPPTEYSDNTQLTDLAGYKIYYGNTESSMNKTITINNPGLSSYIVENLTTNNDYYFSITTFNSKGIESVFSNVVNKTL